MRPQDLSAKLQSKWIRPCVVMKRVGQESYIIRTKLNVEHHAHDDHSKEYKEDIFSDSGKPLYYYEGGSRDIDWQTYEYDVKTILGNQRRKDRK